MNKAELKELVRKVLFEEMDEPEIIQLHVELLNQQFEKVKDPVSEKRMALDMFSAITKVYDALPDEIKKMVKQPHQKWWILFLN